MPILRKSYDTPVLIVDDNQADRLVLRQALKTLGFYEIQEAEDGRLAEYKIENACKIGEPFQLVFVDLRMPRENGLILIESLRSRANTSGMYVIMITGAADLDNVEAAFRKGVDDLLVKPLTLSHLRLKVDKFLNRAA
ncbi:response regulator [Bdellovibrio sp. KM01]|uniref:response regulator n=1 Tax=Bdellovibrio sp. KM01 TaxID=2748865 RepID=UPI0015EA1208|nr:response regulator [Bdellovibrio sp. KM01]QLY24510.1 response regulator [Bdellovibrio sp. KM01]